MAILPVDLSGRRARVAIERAGFVFQSWGARRFACRQNRCERPRTGVPRTRLGFWGGRNSEGADAPVARLRPRDANSARPHQAAKQRSAALGHGAPKPASHPPRPLLSRGSRHFACGQNRRERLRTGVPGTRRGFRGGRNSAGADAPVARLRPREANSARPLQPISEAAQRRLRAAGPPSRREHKRDARRTGPALLQPGRAAAQGPAPTMFVGNLRAGGTAAILASFTSTCFRHAIDPQRYFTQLLTNLPAAPIQQLSNWLPDAWKLRNTTILPTA